MDNKEISFPGYSNIQDSQEPNKINYNQNYGKKDSIKYDENPEENEENDNLGYKPDINSTNFNNFNTKPRLDSTDSPFQAQFKFSIDMPNVSKQRLHEYLNEDLLNELDVSPNIPKLNSDLQNYKNEPTNTNNDPNSLFGFSLYSPEPQNNNNNLDKNNNNFYQEQNFYPNKNWNQSSNPNNNQRNVIYNKNINFNNYNYNINLRYMQNNNNNAPFINSLENNPPMFIPKQMRIEEYKPKHRLLINDKNSKYNNDNEKINKKNKFDSSKKNAQNIKKEGKMKKPFELRAGDWTCTQCNNLNFSFRNVCNRCGIPKEISQKLYKDMVGSQQMPNQNLNFFQNK